MECLWDAWYTFLHKPGVKETIDLVISFATAFGTVAVVVLVVWGDWFKNKLAPPSLTLEPHNLEGDLTTLIGQDNFKQPVSVPAYFYHLKAVNTKRWVIPKNCRVLLKGMTKKQPDGTFARIPLTLPYQFVWSPSEITPIYISITDQHEVDLGRITRQENRFTPVLYNYPNNFAGAVGPKETVRYFIQVVAEGYISDMYVYEIAWDGQWANTSNEMRTHLMISDVTPLVHPQGRDHR